MKSTSVTALPDQDNLSAFSSAVGDGLFHHCFAVILRKALKIQIRHYQKIKSQALDYLR